MTPDWTHNPLNHEWTARVGCVDAIVSLAHQGRKNGPWHAGAFRASKDEDGTRDGPAAYATTTTETWRDLDVAKSRAVAKARQLDAWLRRIVSESPAPGEPARASGPATGGGGEGV